MAAKVSGRARIAGMARSYKEFPHATGSWDIAKKITFGQCARTANASVP